MQLEAYKNNALSCTLTKYNLRPYYYISVYNRELYRQKYKTNYQRINENSIKRCLERKLVSLKHVNAKNKLTSLS